MYMCGMLYTSGVSRTLIGAAAGVGAGLPAGTVAELANRQRASVRRPQSLQLQKKIKNVHIVFTAAAFRESVVALRDGKPVFELL